MDTWGSDYFDFETEDYADTIPLEPIIEGTESSKRIYFDYYMNKLIFRTHEMIMYII